MKKNMILISMILGGLILMGCQQEIICDFPIPQEYFQDGTSSTFPGGHSTENYIDSNMRKFVWSFEYSNVVDLYSLAYYRVNTNDRLSQAIVSISNSNVLSYTFDLGIEEQEYRYGEFVSNLIDREPLYRSIDFYDEHTNFVYKITNNTSVIYKLEDNMYFITNHRQFHQITFIAVIDSFMMTNDFFGTTNQNDNKGRSNR